MSEPEEPAAGTLRAAARRFGLVSLYAILIAVIVAAGLFAAAFVLLWELARTLKGL